MIESISLCFRAARMRHAILMSAIWIASLAAPSAAQEKPAAPPAEAKPPAAPVPPKPPAPPASPKAAKPQPNAAAGPIVPGAPDPSRRDDMKARIRARAEQKGDEAKADGFKEADSDSDGALTKAELAAYMEKRFGKLDADADGKLDSAEFGRLFTFTLPGDARPDPAIGSAMRERLKQPVGPRKAQGFIERYDANKDGKLDKSEAPEGMQRVWDKLDADKDGAITLEEAQPGRSPAMAAKKNATEPAPAPPASAAPAQPLAPPAAPPPAPEKKP